jgi:hypothetical protein
MNVKPEHLSLQNQCLPDDPSRPVYSGRPWLHSQTEFKGLMALENSKNLFGIAGVFIMAAIVVTALSSCTMVSKEMLPGIEYRENPNVEIIEYDDHAKLQEDCLKQHKKKGWRYGGCSLVPYDAKQKCIVRVMAGDEKTKKHELAHCHGHADTFWPWMVDSDFN